MSLLMRHRGKREGGALLWRCHGIDANDIASMDVVAQTAARRMSLCTRLPGPGREGGKQGSSPKKRPWDGAEDIDSSSSVRE